MVRTTCLNLLFGLLVFGLGSKQNVTAATIQAVKNSIKESTNGEDNPLATPTLDALHNEVQQKMVAEIELHRRRLNAQLATQLKEKTALVDRLEKLQAKVVQLQQQKAELQNLKSGIDLEREVRQQKNTLDTLRNNLIEGRRLMEQSLNPVQQRLYRQSMEDFDQQVGHLNHAQLATWLETLLQRHQHLLKQQKNIQQLEGMTIDTTGQKQEGQLIDLGPVQLFKDRQSQHMVLLDPRSKGSLPRWTTLQTTLVSTKDLVMPVDIFKGSALDLLESDPSLLQRLKAGGVLVWPILLIGLVGILGILMRVFYFARHGNIHSSRHPVAQLQTYAQGLRHLDREALTERLYDKIDNLAPEVEKFLGVLNVLASISPLLGLLGTVTGMINSFQNMGSDVGQNNLISGGIAEALTTTACGLIVAIPLMLCHALLQRKAKNMLQQAEARVHQIVDDTLGAATT